jgi:hypothetical protein
MHPSVEHPETGNYPSALSSRDYRDVARADTNKVCITDKARLAYQEMQSLT